jgi:hypothetical protein
MLYKCNWSQKRQSWAARYNGQIIASLYYPQRRSLYNIKVDLILSFISSGLDFSFFSARAREMVQRQLQIRQQDLWRHDSDWVHAHSSRQQNVFSWCSTSQCSV